MSHCSCVRSFPSSRGSLVAPVLLIASLSFFILACQVESEDCMCAASGSRLTIADGRAADVARITTHGPSCDGATLQCLSGGGAPCTAYNIDPVREGACHIDVEFKSGAPPFQFDTEYVRTTGQCCARFYGKDGKYELQVPDAYSDAGVLAIDASRDAAGE